MNKLLPGLILLISFLGSSHATIITLAEYHLGEPGSFVGSRPQDSSGSGIHFTNSAGSIVANTASPSPVSTTYATFDNSNGNDGAWGANFSALPTDNFAVELWARVSNPAQTLEIFQLGSNNTGSLKFHINNGNWAASLHSVTWVGGNGGSGQPATAEVWTHLALIRNSGSLAFYIDGVQQGSAVAQEPVFTASGHIGVQPGGAVYFNGDLDEVRYFTFDPVSDDPVAALNLGSVVPEPSGAALLLLGGLGLWVRFRQR